MAQSPEEVSELPSLVLDANILIRSVLGKRVPQLLDKYAERIDFHTPDVCVDEARRYLRILASKRKFSPEAALNMLDQVLVMIDTVNCKSYSQFERSARERVNRRDPKDWPIVASSLQLACPVWTEDQDLFGTGIATWITATVDIYFRENTSE